MAPIAALLRQVWARSARPEVVLFLLTRVWLVVAYTSVASDVAWAYYPVAHAAVTGAGLPYRDIDFPYPPIALAVVLLPAWIRADISGYHLVFQAEMVLFDVLCFLLMAWFVEIRLQLDRRQTRIAMLVYAALGFALGNIIYDRLDLLIAAAFMGAAVLYKPSGKQAASYYFAIAAGALAKIVPVFWLPVSATQSLVSRGSGAAATWGRPVALWFVAPLAGVLLGVNGIANGGLVRSLVQHVNRGIEIESLWATPFVLGRAAGVLPSISGEVSYGSVNLSGPAISGTLMVLSKYLGFVLIAGLCAWAFAEARRRRAQISDATHLRWLFSITIVLVATQRVFSPQYLIWLIPGFSILVATAVNPLRMALAVGATYALTFALYPSGFEGLATFKLSAAIALAGRNMLIGGLALWSVRDLILALRSEAVVANP